MSRISAAFLFPGSGVELCGKEKVFYENNRNLCDRHFHSVHQKTGVDLTELFFSDKQEKTGDLNSQIFSYSFGCIAADWLISRGISPELTGGYSMGIYAAARSAGFYSFETGLELVLRAHSGMERLYGMGNGGLLAVVGLKQSEITPIITTPKSQSFRCAVVSSEASLVYSGSRKELTDYKEKLEAAGAYKTALLPVDFPYHNPFLLHGAPDLFLREMEDLDFRDGSIPLLSSLKKGEISDAGELKQELANHLATPISWLKLLENLRERKKTTPMECGPGLSLTQIGRFVPGLPSFWNIKNMEKRSRKL